MAPPNLMWKENGMAQSHQWVASYNKSLNVRPTYVRAIFQYRAIKSK